MNEKEILKMMDHISDEYLTEASAAPKRNIKFKKRIIAFAFAAAITASLSIGAVAAYKAFNRESVGTYYDSSAMDKIEQSGYVSDAMGKNEHFELSLDTVMKDDYSIKAVVSVKALDEAAEKYLERSTQMCSELVYADTGEQVQGFAAMFGWQPYEKGKSYPMRLTVPVKNFAGTADLSRTIKLNFIRDENNPESADVDLFKDLSLELKDVKQAKSAKFTAQGGEVINVSEFTIASDIKSQGEDVSDKLKIHYKDGTVDNLEQKINEISYDLFGEDTWVMIIDLKTFIDPDVIDFIECDGVNYKR